MIGKRKGLRGHRERYPGCARTKSTLRVDDICACGADDILPCRQDLATFAKQALIISSVEAEHNGEEAPPDQHGGSGEPVAVLH